MANLVIDIGNTQTKVAVFAHNEMLWFNHTTNVDISAIVEQVSTHKIANAILSSVKKELPAWVKQLPVKADLFTSQVRTKVNNLYASPQTLGADRLAAVRGAIAVNPDMDTLVIDAGTCITYDFIDASNNYYGGSISPGLEMRYKAVHDYTSALPLLAPDEDFQGNFGADTASAIRSGVQNGIKHEAEGFIKSYRQQYPNLGIVLTGGNGIFLDTLLKNSIFAPYIKNDPYLVLKGLNAVIQDQND